MSLEGSGRRAARRLAAGAVVAAVLGAAPPAGAAGSYVVRRGDTLSEIAARHGLTTAALAAANGVDREHRVIAGKTLRIPDQARARTAPSERSYVVAPGDTLGRIAARHATTVAKLAARNGIADANHVRIGRRLVIPAPAGGAPPAPRASTAGLPARLRARPDRLALSPVFDRWSAAYGVPADLVKALAWHESGWQAGLTSSAGAIGVGQLMPATVDFVGDVLLRAELDPRQPEANIRMTARFVRYLLDQTRGDVRLALAAYYQGLRAVRERGVYPVSETYVRNVLAWRASFR